MPQRPVWYNRGMDKKYTADDIKALAKKPYDELTSEERKLVNLNKNMWQKGQSGNPKGYKKGVKNWSTHFQRLMGDPDFLHTVVTTVPADWNGIVGDTPADVIAAGYIAYILRSIAESLKSGKLSKEAKDGIALLSKLGYGDKVVHDIEEGVDFFDKAKIVFEVMPDRPRENSTDK